MSKRQKIQKKPPFFSSENWEYYKRVLRLEFRHQRAWNLMFFSVFMGSWILLMLFSK